MIGTDRRPIAARDSAWAKSVTGVLVRTSITPNQISCASVLFALLGAAALLMMADPLGKLLCAACIVLRLLCNMFDGMAAVEGGKGTPAGALFNEIPDRLADSLFLVALGYAAGLPWLGWLCALLAALTAYVRVLGGSLGLAQDFRGPMAKPHRMWLQVATLLLAAAVPRWSHELLLGGASLIAAGSALTCITRGRAIAARLHHGNAAA
ncbi:MAG TPA: CDP-alcohol phosphatidyltransferase family protein [Rhodanobacter sp.]|nr:CDP-alcohol phosphatidyltransferase family protein [Rhodanobacter sp.]